MSGTNLTVYAYVNVVNEQLHVSLDEKINYVYSEKVLRFYQGSEVMLEQGQTKYSPIENTLWLLVNLSILSIECGPVL